MDIAKARPFDSSTTHRSHPPRDGTQGAGSATILIAWELGGGLGHLIPMTPVVERLLGYGHRVVLVLRDLTRAARVFNGLEVTLLQAPIRTTRSDNHIETPRSFAHILHNNGYADRDELRGLAEGWRNLYDTIRPDLVLCDHSPTALLAASGSGLRTATIGTGFCCPPDTEPLPDFRPWLPNATRQLLDDEHHVLANLNHVLASWNRPNLDRLSLLYRQVDECFLATFEELDHYPLRQDGCYWGTWPYQGGEDSVWPSVPGKRVFAYLKPFPALPVLLAFLSDIKLPTLFYGDRIATALRDRYRSDSLRFADRPLDLNEVGRQCDLAILNGGHGSTSGMLLCGKPILQVPLNLEQTLTAHATVRLGAGLSGDRNNPLDIVSKLTCQRALNNGQCGRNEMQPF